MHVISGKSSSAEVGDNVILAQCSDNATTQCRIVKVSEHACNHHHCATNDIKEYSKIQNRKGGGLCEAFIREMEGSDLYPAAVRPSAV